MISWYIKKIANQIAVWDKNERIHQSQSYLGAKHLSLENTYYILLKKTFKEEKQKNAKGRNSVRIINRNLVIFKIEIAEQLRIDTYDAQ